MSGPSAFGCLAAAALLFASRSGFGTTRTVTNLNDSGAGSLRNTISAAAANDTINFAVTGTVTLTSGELLIDKNLTITGPGASSLTIARGGGGTPEFRIFNISNGANTGLTVTISGLTIHNGKAISGLGSGGGILNERSTLTVDSCVITENSAFDAGGGIYNRTGGGDAITGKVTVINSTFTSNSAYDGGAIYNQGYGNNTALLDLIGSTLAGNSTTNGGGGVYNQAANTQQAPGSATATVTVTNCTLSGNAASSIGGAVANTASGAFTGPIATVTIKSSTLNLNSGGTGGSIYSVVVGSATNAFVYLGNTILRSGQNPLGTGLTSLGYNLSDGNDGFFLNNVGDQVNTDPKLDPAGLQNNGGATQTIALTFGSPAIDKGKSLGAASDQRGSARPFDNAGIVNAPGGDGSDIGAYETSSDAVQYGTPSLVVTTVGDHDDGLCGGADCSLREAIQRSDTLGGAIPITFAPAVTPTITLLSGLGELVISNNTTIAGPGARTLSISGGGAHRVFNVTGGDSTISGLTIRDGVFTSTPGTGAARVGGAIFNSATLTLNDCAVLNNSVVGASNNQAGGAGGAGQGGAVFNFGTLTFVRCTFSGNSAGGAAGSSNSGTLTHGGTGGAGQGGGVFNDAGRMLTVTGCTFTNNTASGGAGGNDASAFGGQGGAGNGGAIFSAGSLTVAGSTIGGNAGNGGAGGTGNSLANHGSAGSGTGGVAVTGPATIGDTICAANTAVGFTISADVDGSITSNGYNLIGTADHSTGFTVTGDQTGTDSARLNPMVGSLQNNGGPTDTMALSINSPAIDKGESFGLTFDQRGHLRIVDSPLIAGASGGDNSDIGAFEFNPLNGTDSDGDGMSDDFETFYGVSDANADPDGDGLTNGQEFQAGTDPRDPRSGLRATAVAKNGNDFVVIFGLAVVGKSYRVERKDAMTDSMWSSINGVSDFSPTFSGSAQLTDPNGALTAKHFYRVRILP